MVVVFRGGGVQGIQSCTEWHTTAFRLFEGPLSSTLLQPAVEVLVNAVFIGWELLPFSVIFPNGPNQGACLA